MKGGLSSPPRVTISHILWSWLGSVIGIYLVAKMGQWFHDGLMDSLFFVGSFGASAVLIYGAPHVEYAQPRNLIGGHIISAIVGVSVFQYFAVDTAMQGALAVSLAIVAMHFTRTLHPPGGATALIAVIGNSHVHQLGYFYVASPIATGAMILLVVALLVNNVSKDEIRHYPKRWL